MGGTVSSRVCIAQFSLWLLGSLSTSSLTNIGLFKCAVRLHASIVAQILRTASAYSRMDSNFSLGGASFLTLSIILYRMCSGLPKNIFSVLITSGTRLGSKSLSFTISRALPFRHFCRQSMFSTLENPAAEVLCSNVLMNIGLSSGSPLNEGSSLDIACGD